MKRAMAWVASVLVAFLPLAAGLYAPAPTDVPLEGERSVLWTPPLDAPHKAASVQKYVVYGVKDRIAKPLVETPRHQFWATVPGGYDHYFVRAVWGQPPTPHDAGPPDGIPVCSVDFDLSSGDASWSCQFTHVRIMM